MVSFVIYAPRYDSISGGAVVLHKLANVLREQGEDVRIWFYDQPHLSSFYNLKFFLSYLRVKIKKYILGRDMVSPYQVKKARHADLKNAIVIYPEIISGNPLNARYIVRWFLNKPGKMTGKIKYGPNELYFYYLEHFNDWQLNPHRENKLHVAEIQSQIYRESPTDSRSGTCYMVRKGRERPLSYHDQDAICIDGMSHREVADVFNRTKYFISYDLYTMYSRFAAMCGCIPVVVPDPNLSKEEWRPVEQDRHGVAYGWEDIDWAIETRDLMLERLALSEQQSKESVKAFVEKAKNHFGLQS